MPRTQSKPFIEKNFPDLLQYKRRTSRMYESKDKPSYFDDWWFNFYLRDLESSEFMIFAGAKDYINQEFMIFKVPTSYLLSNLEKISVTDGGWINLYIHTTSYLDVRTDSGVSFGQFAVN